MKAKNRNLFLVLLTFLIAISCVGMIMPVHAEEQAVAPKFEMIGASVRLNDPTGIRFAARVDEAKYDEVISGSDSVFGAIIIPKDILGEIEINASNNHVTALSGKTYLDSINNYSQGLAGKVEKDAQNNPTGYYTINYSVSNVKYGNLNREFYGLVYVRSGAEGNYTYEYATIENSVNERTVADVAKAYYPIAEDDEVATLENLIYKAEFLANDTESGDYETSEANARAYVAAQKTALAEFNTIATTTTANQLSINTAMDKYNALGDFAKTLVAESKAFVDEKQATVCNTIKTAIAELSEQATYAESDYHKIYGLKASYSTLPEEVKASVDNYSELTTIEEEYLTYYEVEVVYGATETENDYIGKDGYNNVPSLSYEYDTVYGPIIKVSNVGGEQRISAQIKKNYDNSYAGYNLHFNVSASNYAAPQYINTSNTWTQDEYVRLSSNTWTQFSYSSSLMGIRNNARHIAFHILGGGNFKVSAIFAIRQTELGQINSKIAELNDKSQLVAEDYHVIYGIKTNYQSLSQEIQSKIDYETLLEVETKFLNKFVVYVVHGATEAEGNIRGNGSNNRMQISYENDWLYGATIVGTNKNSQQNQSMHIAGVKNSEYSNCTIYFNIKTSELATIHAMGSDGNYSGIETLNPNTWTQISLKYSELGIAAQSFSDGARDAWTIRAMLNNGKTIKVSAIFAIRPLYEGDGEVVFGENLSTKGVTTVSSDTWGATETISTVSKDAVISETYTYDGTYSDVIKVDVKQGASGNKTHWAVTVDYKSILSAIKATDAESVTVNIWSSKDTSVYFGGFASSGFISLSGTTATLLSEGWNSITITKADLENIISNNVSMLCKDYAGLPLTLLISDFYLDYAQA